MKYVFKDVMIRLIICFPLSAICEFKSISLKALSGIIYFIVLYEWVLLVLNLEVDRRIGSELKKVHSGKSLIRHEEVRSRSR